MGCSQSIRKGEILDCFGELMGDELTSDWDWERGTAFAEGGLCESKMHSKQQWLGITRT